jgi:transcriptional regulator
VTDASDGLDLLQGTLDVLILKTLSWGPRHGYAVARWILEVSGDVLRVEEGALYPALHRLERRGWIESEWGLSENNRRAKYYQLTPLGRQQLGAKSTTWAQYAAAVGRVLAVSPTASTAVSGADR